MEAVIKGKIRSDAGSSVCKKMRSNGSIPAVLYGKGEKNIHLVLSGVEINQYFRNVKENKCQLDIDSECVSVLIKEVQRHPISRDILHIDFVRS